LRTTLRANSSARDRARTWRGRQRDGSTRKKLCGGIGPPSNRQAHSARGRAARRGLRE
jgi:hypothetical protein